MVCEIICVRNVVFCVLLVYWKAVLFLICVIIVFRFVCIFVGFGLLSIISILLAVGDGLCAAFVYSERLYIIFIIVCLVVLLAVM